MATYFARQVLQACGRDTALTDAWFAAQKPGSVLEEAASLLAAPGRVDARAYLVAARTSDGGWGEYPGMPAQVFDTAIAVIALRGDARGRVAGDDAADGIAELCAAYLDDGLGADGVVGWPYRPSTITANGFPVIRSFNSSAHSTISGPSAGPVTLPANFLPSNNPSALVTDNIPLLSHL